MADGDRTRGKGPLESTRVKGDMMDQLMEKLQRDELRGMKFYIDENWRLVYLPEEASSPCNLTNDEVEHEVPVYLITEASRCQLEPTLEQGSPHCVGNSSVKPEEPGQSAHVLQNLPPQKPMEEHVPFMPQGSGQATCRPKDLCWKYARRIPNGNSYGVQCNLCGRVICNISRMKEPLACTGANLPCPSAITYIRDEIVATSASVPV